MSGLEGRQSTLDAETASRIWDVLVEECGASEQGREDFIRSVGTHGLTEYRFCGWLGFGGKVWLRPYPPAPWFDVNCYPEDLTEERETAMQLANARLAELSA